MWRKIKPKMLKVAGYLLCVTEVIVAEKVTRTTIQLH